MIVRKILENIEKHRYAHSVSTSYLRGKMKKILASSKMKHPLARSAVFLMIKFEQFFFSLPMWRNYVGSISIGY